MKFCKSCGTSIKPEDTNCSNCGAEIQKPKTSKEESISIDLTKIKNTIMGKIPKFNKTHKVIALVSILVLVLGFGGIKIGQALNTPDKFIENFQEAVLSNDSEALKSIIRSSDPQLEVNEMTVNTLLEYINDRPSYLPELIRELELQADNLEYGKQEEQYVLTLKKDGKKGLFFDNYILEPKVYYFNIYSTYEGTEIYVNNQLVDALVDASNSKEYGPYLPGNYTFKAVYKGDYDTIETEQQRHVFDQYSNNLTIDLSLHASYVYLYSDLDTQLYLNNNKTDIEFNGEFKFGPISNESNFILHGESAYPWGKLASDQYSTNDYSSVHFSYGLATEEIKNEIMDVLNEFNMNVFKALSLKDTSGLTNLSDDLLREVEGDMERIGENYQHVNVLNHTFYDLENFSINYNKSEGIYYGSIRGGIDFEHANIYTPLVNVENDEADGIEEIPVDEIELLPKTEYYDYNLFYSVKDQTWVISRASQSWRFNISEEKRFDF